MRRAILLVSLFITSLVIVACNKDNHHVFPQPLFNQPVEITLYSIDRDLARRAIDAVTHDLKLIDSYTDVKKSKPLSRTNVLLQSKEWFSVNPSLYELITQSKDFFQVTQGAFNPVALGVYRQAWGFYQQAPAPDLGAIKVLLKQDLSMNDIEIDGIRVRGTKPDLRLDFDLLSIGYAIDNQLQHLSALGVSKAKLRIGPIVGTMGEVSQSINLKTQTRKFSLSAGEAMCHFSARDSRFPSHGRIDPRSAWPVKPIPTVVVIHENTRLASIACAVLSTADENEWEDLIVRLNLTYAWRQQADYEQITSAMRARINES